MLVAPANGSDAGAGQREVDQRRVALRASAVNHARPDHDTLARHNGDRLPFEIAEQVERELRTVEILLHDGIANIRQEEIQLAAIVDAVHADASTAASRLDEEGKRHIDGRVDGTQVGAAAMPWARSCSQVASLSLQMLAVDAWRDRDQHTGIFETGACSPKQLQLVVDRRDDEADVLVFADSRYLVEIAVRLGRRHSTRDPRRAPLATAD